MIDSEEEYIMDFKAEERRAQLFHLEDTLSDCTTLSASEIDSNDDTDSTPHHFCKLKNFRVMIKKLPQDILTKYKSSCIKTPLRSSGRIKDKHIPAGKYLALHKNKPLHKLQDRKRKINVLKTVEKSKFENQSSKLVKKNILPDHSFLKRNLKSTNLSSDSSCKPKNVTTPLIIPGRYSYNKLESTLGKTNYRNKASLVTTTKNADKRIANPSKSHRSLHERIATTRLIQKPAETLPKLHDIRHNVPPTSRHHVALNSSNVSNTVWNSMGRNTLHNEKTSAPHPKSYCSKNNLPKVFPTFITPAPSIKESRHLQSFVRTPTVGFQRHSLPSLRKLTIRAIKMPNDISKASDPIPVASPEVFFDKQSLGMDSLNTPTSFRTIAKQRKRQISKENTTDNGSEICLDFDSDSEQTDVEKQAEPEVIKRIIYHTKSVQTKFTCNGSICGLVDSDEFNLNCFYCYEIFPLHKWLEFKEHIKHVHKVEEGSELSDSDVDFDNAYTRSHQELCSENLSPSPRYINENGRRNFTTKSENSTKPFYNKLPLEPRLLAERQNKSTGSCKILSSTPTNSKPFKIVAPSRTSDKSVKFSSNQIDEVINLDSDDDCGQNISKPDMAKKTAKIDLQVDTTNTNKTAPPAPVPASAPTPNTKFITIPPTTNVQNVTKTLPKPTVNQFPAANGNNRPRYFVVKKIIKLPATDQVPKALDSTISRTTIPMKMSEADHIEDSVPKPTSGLGILFGLTNTMVVIEFLLKLKTSPVLWRCQENINTAKYNASLKKLCAHLNNRFDLNMTEFEMFLSIQRVKDWYYLMLQSIHEHNKDPNNTEPYKHRFPIYFNILSQYLTPDADEKGIRLNEIINKTALAAKASSANLNEKAALGATETRSIVENQHSRRSSTISATSPNIEQSSKDNSQNQEATADSLIEFDADTLYGQESSEEETLDEFDKFFKSKPSKRTTVIQADGTQKKRTKVYIGRFECDICHKVYKRNCDLKRHRVLHFPPQFECSQCLLPFYFKHWADRCSHDKHKRYSRYKRVDKASGEKRIWPKKIFRFNMICEICGNSYRSIGSLNTHKRDKHLNQRNTCVVCNFTALSNWRIVQHQRKRHIVEPGLPEEVAKKSRARTESKSSFSNEARLAFDWRREMRKKLKPGEKFYGCCRCKIIFNTRKEKVFHNKIEHPITEFTVICLLCLPNKLLLSNSNCARRHYTDIHKVPWHEIDGLVKCTKPIFSFLNKEEIELLKASENYKELLDELLKDKKLQSVESIQLLEDEASKAVLSLPQKELGVESAKVEVECTEEENLYVDGIIDNDNCSESNYKQLGYASINEHNYSEEHVIDETYSGFDVLVDNSGEEELYFQQSGEEGAVHVNADIETNNECRIENYIQNDQEYDQNIVEELIEENIVVEEFIDEVIGEDENELI